MSYNHGQALAVLVSLVECVESAIDSGDWKVDGACDPSLFIDVACALLRDAGYVRNSIDNSFYKEQK